MAGRLIGVAITIPEPWGSLLAATRRSAGDLAGERIPPHITLVPPTELAPEALDEFIAALTEIARRRAPFSVLLRGTGTFRPVTDVVFIALAQGISECEQLESALRALLPERASRFPYHPHVTIAHDVPEAALDYAFVELAGFRAEFLVESFTLFLHEPRHPEHEGTFWRPAHELRLGGAA